MIAPTSSSPAIQRIGFDVLSTIFYELAHLEYKSSPGHLESLLLVNREWRSYALARPSIWSMFYLTWQNNAPPLSIQRWRNRTIRFLQRSKASTLTINMQFSGLPESHAGDTSCICTYERDWLGKIDVPVDMWCDNTRHYWEWASTSIALLVGAEGEHMKRWRDLEIHWDELYTFLKMDYTSPESSLFRGMCYPTPTLKRLSLNGVDMAFGGVLSAIPALQTLIMNQCYTDPLRMLPTRLKYLELSASSLPNLSNLSTLEHLKIGGTPYSQEEDAIPFQEWVACTLPGLRVLELRLIPTSCLHKLIVPNLHSLVLHAPQCFKPNYPHEPEEEDEDAYEEEEEEMVDPAELQAILPIIETLSIHWNGLRGPNAEREEFIERTIQAVLETAIGLAEIRLDAELYYGTRVMLRDKPHLVPELQRVMVFREGVPVEVDGRNIAGRLGVAEWRVAPQFLAEGWAA